MNGVDDIQEKITIKQQTIIFFLIIQNMEIIEKK